MQRSESSRRALTRPPRRRPPTRCRPGPIGSTGTAGPDRCGAPRLRLHEQAIVERLLQRIEGQDGAQRGRRPPADDPTRDRVWQENREVYGVRKVGEQLRREGQAMARGSSRWRRSRPHSRRRRCSGGYWAGDAPSPKTTKGAVAPFAPKHRHSEPRIISACAAGAEIPFRASPIRRDSAYRVRE